MLSLVGLLASCAQPTGDADLDLELKVRKAKFIHVGGLCSSSFLLGQKKGAPTPRLGRFEGIESIDARVDQHTSMAQATADLRDVLDAQCTGDSWCYLYTYSNGGAVLSRTLALHETDRWNLLWALTVASNEGGSELSGSMGADLAVWMGMTCDLASEVAPTDHRNGWNHGDTAGMPVYTLAGRRESFYTGTLPDFFGGNANDGSVAYHSSGGLNDTWFISDDDPWLCWAAEWHWANHQPAFSCEGLDFDHGEMQLAGLRELGG